MKHIKRKINALGLPLLVVFLLLYILPFLYTVWYALLNNAFDGEFVGLQNFLSISRNRYFRLALGNTALITLLLVGTTALGALLLAFFLHGARCRSVRLMALLVLPMLIPSVSAAAIWRQVFQTGAFADAPTCYTALTTLFLWKYTGAAAVLLHAGLRAIELSILDAAAIDGAGPVRTYVSICLPCVRDHLAVMLMLLLMFAFRIYKESYLLFDLYPSNEMYLIAHYMSNHFMKLNYQNVAVSSVSLAVFALLMFGIAVAIRRGEGTEA